MRVRNQGWQGLAWRGGEGARSSLTSKGVVRGPVLDHKRGFRPALVGDEVSFVSRFETLRIERSVRRIIEFFFEGSDVLIELRLVVFIDPDKSCFEIRSETRSRSVDSNFLEVDAVPAVQERGRGLLDLQRGAGNDLQRIRVGLDLVEVEFFVALRLDGDGRHHRREAEGRENHGLVGALHGCSSVLDRRGGTCLCLPFPFVFLDLPHICPNPAIRSEPLLGDFYSLRNS